jgi:molybdate/tungstate transport system substrate-binding protein
MANPRLEYPNPHYLLKNWFVPLCLTAILLAGCASQAVPTQTAPPAATLAPSPLPSASPTGPPTPLMVFCAGSLIQPFADLEKAFESKYPQIDVRNECHGSIQVIRHVTELHELIDVVATADAALIPMLMYQTTNPETGLPYANWHIRFASNRLGLAYTEQSQLAETINAENWAQVLSDPQLRVGLADPRFDAAGYRSLMAFALAQYVTGNYRLFIDMFNGQFTQPITIFIDDEETRIDVPEILETTPDAHILLRGASIQLIALLESGDLDYAFEYESVIRQHGLKLLSLPDEVNLSVEDLNDFYQQVLVNLDFQRFSTIQPEFRGEQIGYGITIPSNASHPEAAGLFIEFLLGPEGRAIMDANFHPVFASPEVDGCENIPPSLAGLCQADN